MGSAISTPSDNEDQFEDPWWPIDNINFSLHGPNLGPVNVPLRRDSVKSNLSSEIPEQEISNTIASEFKSASENRTIENKGSVVEIKSTKREQTLEEFKEELRAKRMTRQSAIFDLRNELTDLRRQLETEREINRKFKSRDSFPIDMKDASTSTGTDLNFAIEISEICEKDPSASAKCSSTSLRSQLAQVQLSLQLVNAENLSLTTELGVMRNQVASLKEVIVCSKEMIQVREEQVTQLKDKLREIEDSLAERELKIMSDNLRQEYDRQLANIRNLRQLYEERARVSVAERENLLRQISIKKDELAAEIEKSKNLEERVSSLEAELTTSNKNLTTAKIHRDEYNYENKGLKEEMAVINKLFSQMLMGFNGANNLDIDRLTTMLEENRTLLNEMATAEGNSEGACLPKLLFEIVKEANTEEEDDDEDDIEEDNSHVASAQEIIGNLPKVWRVLMELLNHQKIEQVEFQENGQSEDCYKSVQTPTGPKIELSVSKTYIKLKDLILEKKALQKETTKLKTLNGHLERRLHDQEKRLSTVSLELTKTWHLVGKMQRQHRQLHTHEQILRYQLQQKRRLLNELKEELEYCRRKWAAARAKNDESQLQCDDLRREFAKRKLQDANNSAESGYSDGPVSDEDDVEDMKKKRKDIFETSRKFERTHSQSPTRSIFHGVVKRCNSAPRVTDILTEPFQTTNDIASGLSLKNVAANSLVMENALAMATVAKPPQEMAILTVVSNPTPSTSGTVPKLGVRLSRSKRQEKHNKQTEISESLEEMFLRLSGKASDEEALKVQNSTEKRVDRAIRIQRLEEQCKSLITQVIETSSCREELNEQLSRFQEELAPANKVILTPNIETKPPTTEACLTVREEEYTARRAERLKRLEDESKQLMTRIKKTTDRGKSMTSLLDQLHSRCVNSREGSFDEPDSGRNSPKLTLKAEQDSEPIAKLTQTEEEYTTRRAERIKRLEEESRQLLNTVSRNAQRGTDINSKLDELHTKYGPASSKELSNDIDNGPSSQPINDCVELTVPDVVNEIEEESQKLSNTVSINAECGTDMNSKLDELHKKGPTSSKESTIDIDNSSSNQLINDSVEPTVLDVVNEIAGNASDLHQGKSSTVSPQNLECASVDCIDSEEEVSAEINGLISPLLEDRRQEPQLVESVIETDEGSSNQPLENCFTEIVQNLEDGTLNCFHSEETVAINTSEDHPQE